MRLSKDLGTLQDVCHVKVGVQVLWNDAFQIVAEKIVNGFIYGHSKIDKNIVVEYDACKPLLCNEQFAPLTKRKYQTFALFPYEVSDNGEVTELSLSEFTVLYPKAGAYLANHKKLICENVQTLPEKNNSYNKKRALASIYTCKQPWCHLPEIMCTYDCTIPTSSGSIRQTHIL